MESSFILQRPSQIIRKHVDAIFSNDRIIPNVELALRSIETPIMLVHGNVTCFGTITHIRISQIPIGSPSYVWIRVKAP